MRAARLVGVTLTALGALALPGSAWAHAVLERSAPERGAELEHPPAGVELYFNEPVEASFGAIRVFDAAGELMESGKPSRPGDASTIGVALPGDLADGTYTATYRVVSADSHPISGGFVFSVGDPGSAPAASVSELLSGSEAGAVTGATAGVARFLVYAATALVIGALALALLAFCPTLRAGAWPAAASGAFDGSLRRIVAMAAVVGAIASVAGILLQGATAGGTSLWDALDTGVVGEVLETRFGVIWALRLLAFATIAVFALALRPMHTIVLAVPAAFLLVAPALAGHAGTQSPRGLLIAANSLHVGAVSVWVGGIATILVAVRAATSRVAPDDRTGVLAAVLARFSGMAVLAVAAVIATGAIQSIVHLEALADLWETGFGRPIAVKLAIVAALVAIGALHRRRLLPRVNAAAQAGAAPGGAGRAVRRALMAEAALFAAALAATAVLVGQAPPSALSEGPQSASATLGAARVDLTVEPALTGSNEVHIYMFDARDGAPYDDLRGFELEATLPAEGIGPIAIDLQKAGPGHYTAADAPLGIAGEWTLTLSGRTSRFEAPRAQLAVEIE